MVTHHLSIFKQSQLEVCVAMHMRVIIHWNCHAMNVQFHQLNLLVLVLHKVPVDRFRKVAVKQQKMHCLSSKMYVNFLDVYFYYLLLLYIYIYIYSFSREVYIILTKILF